MKYNLLIWLIFSLFFFSCKQKNPLQVDTSKINAKANVIRFDKIFYQAKPEDLPKIKSDFKNLFPKQVTDSLWLAKMKDTLERELFIAVQKEFGDFSKEKNDLTELFKHVKYYYPKFKDPKIITILTNITYDDRVVYNKDTLYISLDVFLGKDHPFYKKYLDYPKYIVNTFTKEQLLVNSAKEIAQKVQIPQNNRTFLDKMIQRGKVYYTTQAFLPEMPENEIIHYLPEQQKWTSDNEKMIWTYFLDKNLLYDTNPKLDRRFLEEAPFTKFYLDIDNETPGRIGEWVGLQIVKSYMQKNDVSLPEMLQTPNTELFKKSKYKPKR